MSLLTDLISYWKLDEASGNALDSHGSSELTASSNPASTTGKIGNARDLEADDAADYFGVFGGDANLDTGNIDFTFAGWFNLESKAASMSLVAKGGLVSLTMEYEIGYDLGADKFYFLVSSDGSVTTTVFADTHGSPSAATWCYIVAWHDSVNDIINIQINNGTVDDEIHSDGITANNDAWFRFGASGDTGSPNQHFDGLIDECGFWKRVLTSGERTQLYNGGAGLTHPFTATATQQESQFSMFIPYLSPKYNNLGFLFR